MARRHSPGDYASSPPMKIVMIETFRKALTALSVAERTRRSSGCEPGRPLWRKRHHHKAFPMNR